MFEQKEMRNLKICASVIVGTLALTTFSGGFYLLYCDHMLSHPTDFFTGVGIALGSAATMTSIGYCAVKSRFFKPEGYHIQQNNKLTEISDKYVIAPASGLV